MACDRPVSLLPNRMGFPLWPAFGDRAVAWPVRNRQRGVLE
jgi:hypothetical protein